MFDATSVLVGLNKMLLGSCLRKRHDFGAVAPTSIFWSDFVVTDGATRNHLRQAANNLSTYSSPRKARVYCIWELSGALLGSRNPKGLMHLLQLP